MHIFLFWAFISCSRVNFTFTFYHSALCGLMYPLTDWLTDWLAIYVEQGIHWQATSYSAGKQIPHILWNKRFITVFITSCHLSISWARLIQSTPSSRPTVILSSHVQLPHQRRLLQISSSKPRRYFSCPPFTPHAPPTSSKTLITIIVFHEVIVQTMKFLVKAVFSNFLLLLSLRPKYFS